MIAARLLVWLMALPVLHDGHGADIPRPEREALVIANAAAETEQPQFWAGILDVFAAYESGYGPATIAGGCPGVPVGVPCKREQGARYCGAWMTECRRVPHGATLLDEARVAIAMMRESFSACPEHPFGQFAGVGCRAHPLTDFRAAAVRREMAVSLPPADEVTP